MIQACHAPLSLLVVLFCAPLVGAQDSSADASGSVTIGDQAYPYRLLAPASIAAGESYPLVLFLHGAGERGSDNEAQMRHFPERMLQDEYRRRFPCFVLAPQCPTGSSWTNTERGLAQGGPTTDRPAVAMTAAISAMHEVLAAQPIDRDRIYLTGLSMGGAGTWDLAARHPEWFAAAVPICGGGDTQMAPALAGLPLFVWHGESDHLIYPERSREMVAAVQAAGGEVQYRELPGVGHNSWETAYALDQAIDWMFTKRRDNADDLIAAQRALAQVVAPNERIAFLGDSITQAGNAAGGYVDLLRTGLQATHSDVHIIPAGISGHKVPDLLARYEADVIEKGATLVFLYIGINDVWHSEWDKGTSPEDFEQGLRRLIRDFRETGAEVVLATASVIGEKRPGENRLDAMLSEYAALSRKVAAEEGATLCDLQRAFHDHLSVFNGADAEKGVLTTDGVHLNAAGNQLLAIEAARGLRTALMARNRRNAEPSRALKVFLLAGQSNMEGKGAVNTLEQMRDDPTLAPLLAALEEGDGWRTRDDVWIRFLDRWGRLTVGYGSPAGARGMLIGPELGFGWVVGDHLDDPVLLVKMAWGGKDVAVDFLPPSEGGPGEFYGKMIQGLRETLDGLDLLFPDMGATEIELAGFVWFQGWNDMVDRDKTAAYAQRMKSLIRDLRTELDSPELPVVIGELGVGGPNPSEGVARFRAAQAEIANDPEFRDLVRLVRTSELYDMQAHALYEAGVWKGDDKERYYRVASDRPYHYLGSGKVYYRMGHALGEAMVELLEKP